MTQHQLEIVTSHLSQILWATDAAGVATFHNQRWFEYTGQTFEEAQSLGWRSVIHPDDIQAARSRWQQSLQSGNPLELECRLRRGCDGMYRWHLVRTMPVCDADGVVSQWVGTSTDIHETRAEKDHVSRVIDRMRKLQSVTSALAKGLNTQEVGGVLLQQGFATFGSGAGILLRALDGSPHLEVVATQSYKPTWDSFWQKCLPTRALPVPHALRTGEAIFLDDAPAILTHFPELQPMVEQAGLQGFVALPLVGKNSVIAAVGFAFYTPSTFDEREREFFLLVTGQCAQALERAALFESERRQKEDLEVAIRARDEFLSIASHELKTPLTSIKLQVQMARRRIATFGGALAAATVKVHELLEQSDKSVERLSRLVDDMLDISHIATGRLALSVEAFDLNDLVEDVTERLSLLFLRSGSAVRTELHERAVGSWDRFRLDQVITNLLTNAVKYGQGKPIRVVVLPRIDAVQVQITDYGRGIALHDQERIFERFERAVSAREISGLGLGLYIVRHIVARHDGTITVQSKPNEGSTFTVTLPWHTQTTADTLARDAEMRPSPRQNQPLPLGASAG